MSKLLRNAVRLGSSVRAAHTCTLIPGDGIGPEISESVQKIFQSAGVSIRNIFLDIKSGKFYPNSRLQLIGKKEMFMPSKNQMDNGSSQNQPVNP